MCQILVLHISVQFFPHCSRWLTLEVVLFFFLQEFCLEMMEGPDSYDDDDGVVVVQ